MDPSVSVQNKNFTGNSKKLAKVFGTREEAKKEHVTRRVEGGVVREDGDEL